MMGGFAFSTSLVPDLSEDKIRDKSKTDDLAKSLVCLFVVRCTTSSTSHQLCKDEYLHSCSMCPSHLRIVVV